MIYHRYRFGIKGNFKVLLCRIFGHRLNENPAFHWCERCGLYYGECYHPENWVVETGLVKLKGQEKIDYDVEKISRNLSKD